MLIRAKKIVGALLFLSLFTQTFTYEKLDVSNIYNSDIEKNLTEKSYDVSVLDYDFDGDSKLEKVVIATKKEENSVDVYISIYASEEAESKLLLQLYDKQKLSASTVKSLASKLENLKAHYKDLIKDISDDEVRYITMFGSNLADDQEMNLQYSENSPKDLDNFVFVEKNTFLKDAPVDTATNTIEQKYKSKPKLLFEINSNKAPDKSWFYVEAKEENDTSKFGFISSDLGIKRGFYWNIFSEKINQMNDFLRETKTQKKDLYIITMYVPLGGVSGVKKDKFGNRPTQSIRGYEKSTKGDEFINIPDQTVFRITGEKDGLLEIETPYYGGPYYIENNEKTMKKVDLPDTINRFIGIDTHSQTEGIFEKNKETGKYDIITYSHVTTGRDNGGSSYATPYGSFLVAFTRTYMMFTKTVRKDADLAAVPKSRRIGSRTDLIVAGEAPYAIRFSGGAYMHGLPGAFGISRASARAGVGQKIGTYQDSLKCIRHYDDQIKFIFEWASIDNWKEDSEDIDRIKTKEPTVVIAI